MDNHHPFIIVGAGPAGVQLAYFFEQQHRDYLLLEKGGAPGSFFKKFPIHRKLISINKPHTGYIDTEKNLRWDWNSLLGEDAPKFTDYTKEYFPHADHLVSYLEDFTFQCELNIRVNANVARIEKKAGVFHVVLDSGEAYTCDSLVIATGFTQPYLPDIPGIELTTNYEDLTLDKNAYINKRVLIVGKGNSGFEVADHLMDAASTMHIVSPSPLAFAWKTHFVGNLRAVNNNFLDTYQLKSLNGVLNADVVDIKKVGDQFDVAFQYRFASSESEVIRYDHVIVATGFRMDDTIFADNIKPEMTINNRLPNMTSDYESTNVSNLFFAGVLMQVRDYKREQSAFIHGFRYNVKFLSHVLGQRYFKKPFPAQPCSFDAESIAEKILCEVNRSSAMWQQTGYLCDVLIVFGDRAQCQYVSCLPVDFVQGGHLTEQDYFIITLEFGQDIIDGEPDIFQIERVHKADHKHAHLSTFIHPIVRYFRKNKLVSEHHIIEDFEALWEEPEHIEPLKTWLGMMIEKMSEPGENLVLFKNTCTESV